MRKFIFILTGMLIMTIATAVANKTSVEVKAPGEVKKGAEITITLNVTHSGNSRLHYTDWVNLSINGEEVKRWEYDRDNLPPDSDFTLEFKYTVPEDLDVEQGLQIEAEGNCNMHGTTGPGSAVVKITE